MPGDPEALKAARKREGELQEQLREKEAQISHLKAELQTSVSKELSQRERMAECEEKLSAMTEQKQETEQMQQYLRE
jgi:hypothetical protein